MLGGARLARLNQTYRWLYLSYRYVLVYSNVQTTFSLVSGYCSSLRGYNACFDTTSLPFKTSRSFGLLNPNLLINSKSTQDQPKISPML